MKRVEKEKVVLELREKLRGVKSALLTDFRGLSVAEITELRNLLRKSSIHYRVVKNSLAELAFHEIELRGLQEYLHGPMAIAWSYDDPIAPSRVLIEFAKTKPTFQVKAGYVEGKVMGPTELLALSELPPREVLLARFLGGMQASLQGLVGVLKGQVQALIIIMDTIRGRKEKD